MKAVSFTFKRSAIWMSFIVAIGSCFLSSCASVQREAAPAQADRPERGKALVVFYRERRFVGGGVSYKVFDNGTRIGGLPNGAYFVYQAKPGAHKFTASTESTAQHVLTLDAGQTYYVRGEVHMGVMVGRPELVIADSKEAVAAIKDLHRVKMKP